MAAASAREMFDLNANVDGGEDEDLEREEEEDNEENAETNSATNPLSKKRRYHRHTPAQIQKLESVYKECPHPNKKERMDISEELGLEPLQIKFWFQNKRTQMKSKHERDEVRLLRAEIGRLKNENKIYKEALSSGCCSSCAFTAAGGGGGDDHLLRMENARLKDEIDRISAIAAKYVGVEKVEPLE